MDPEASPPKRVTRARAAAKKVPLDNGIKVATAAAKAKATRTMPAAMAKRKTRADDLVNDEDHDDLQESIALEPEKPRATRGRQRKTPIVQAEPAMEEVVEEVVVVPRTRGRPRKVVEEKQAVDSAPALEAPRTRARGRKVVVPEEQAPPAPEPPRRIVRGRQAALTKPTATVKKSVKFEDTPELDKENVVPTTKGKAPEAAATGIRAKPARKAAAATRVTRGRARAASESDQGKTKSPLSPKKPTQVAVARDATSDDELATMEKTQMPLMKSPIKPQTNTISPAKQLDFTTSIVSNRAITTTQDPGSSIMASPARRMPQSPWKGTLKESPKRNAFGEPAIRSPFKASMPPPSSTNPALNASLLQSPARRPLSPTKISASGSPTRATSDSVFGATPRPKTFSISRFTTPRTLTKSAFRPGKLPFNSTVKPATESRLLGKEQVVAAAAPIVPFTGRLSAVLPRYADPALSEEPEMPAATTMLEASIDHTIEAQCIPDVLTQESTAINDVDEAMVVEELQSTTPINSPSGYSCGNFGLRLEQEDPFQDSDSEDELASASPLYSPGSISAMKMSSKDFAIFTTPKKLSFGEKTPVAKGVAQIGFTPLAKQLDDWMAPVEPQADIVEEEPFENENEPIATPSAEEQTVEQRPVQSSFFDDEMIVREEAEQESEHDLKDAVMEAIEFAPAELDDEDFALAAEADELSLIEEESENSNDDVDVIGYAAEDRAVSEASQEYADENMVPIDPELLSFGEQVVAGECNEPRVEITVNVAPQTENPIEESKSTPLAPRTVQRPTNPFTPVRTSAGRTFHTICKVPLRAEGVESPLKPSPRKRPMSASRVTAHRTPPPPPTLLCYEEASTLGKASTTNWSTSATPTRTPRRDLNNNVLRGAVVYVDVHTSEGADASAVFMELLGQMGAKCVKTWGWNPNSVSPPGSIISPKTAESAKVGITHVVFKDGGKRTLEKVRETNGVVLCVGVGWVLDCERMNQWLDESPYFIDTTLVPRGGHRRRKSMEPRALANLNGTLISTPSRSSSKDPQSYSAPATAPPARIGRRESTRWVRTPRSAETATNDQDQDIVMDDYTLADLSPLPKTPSAEALSMYAEHILDNEGGVEETPYFSGRDKEELVMQTVPVNKMMSRENGQSAPVPMGSEALMQRLMLARRKSLQWAPKVGSPLARQ